MAISSYFQKRMSSCCSSWSSSSRLATVRKASKRLAEYEYTWRVMMSSSVEPSSNRQWKRLRQTPKSAGAAPPSTGSNAVASWPAAPTFNFFPTFPANPTRTYELVSKQRVRISFESYVILLKCERLISTTSESTPSPRAQVVHRAPFCLYCLEDSNLTLPLPQTWNNHNVKRRGL